MRARAGISLAALLGACATAPRLDVTAGPGEPNALDSMCSLSRMNGRDFQGVWVDCPLDAPPTAADVQASLVEGFDIALVPGGPRFSGVTITSDVRHWSYQYVVDTRERPLLTPPVFPDEPSRLGHVATCVARFDLTPDGRAENSCVQCAATGSQQEFEAAARAAVSGWLYEPGRARTGVVEGLKFCSSGPDGVQSDMPATPETVCGAPVTTRMEG